MKKSSRIISITSLFVSGCLILTIVLGTFVVTEHKNNSYKSNQQDNYAMNNYEFFKNDKKKIGQRWKLMNNIDNVDIIFNFTNFIDNFDWNNLKFDTKLVAKNLINFVKQILGKNNTFKKIDDFYIKINYFVDELNLYLDIKWANLNDILNAKQTNLYWDNLKISLS